MPRSRGRSQLTVGELAQMVRALLEPEDDEKLTLDDCLWCYAYEPACQQLRSLLNREVGASNKNELIDWCYSHTREDAIDVIDQAAVRGGWLHYTPQPT